jgi:serine/threonine protein kinase
MSRAAELWSILSHPQLTPIQHAGWWDDSPYFVMEYAPAGSLADSLRVRPFPVREAVNLVERLAEIVAYLHRQGVVHGNLKPSNVLLAANGIPRLVDLHPTSSVLQSLADCPSAVLAYLAPEQLEDFAADPRPYTDIYGLGLILYELLTGRKAFSGASPDDVRRQVLSHDPAPPSTLNSKSPPALDALCLRCLRKNPWRRFERVFDLLKWLRTLKDSSRRVARPQANRRA